MRWALAVLLIAHGWVHLNVWGSSKMAKNQGTRSSYSWLLGEQEALANLLKVATMISFGVAGLALILTAPWWGVATVVAASMSLLLVALFPHAILNAWMAAPVVIDLVLLVGILGYSWPDSPALGG
jgi:hypothetical protein